MPKRISTTTAIGGLTGAVASIAVLVLLAPFLLPRTTATPLNDGTARVVPLLQFTGLDVELPHLMEFGDTILFESTWSFTPLFMLSLLSGIGFALAGALTVALVRWIPRALDDETESSRRVGLLYANGIGIGAVIGVLAANFAVTWAGEAGALATQLEVFRFLLILIVAGVILGAAVAGSTHVMLRPDIVGMRGNTWESRSEFLTAARRALSFPVVAFGLIAVLVIATGLGLLALGHELGHEAPVVFAGVVAALILGAASFAAYRR